MSTQPKTVTGENRPTGADLFADQAKHCPKHPRLLCNAADFEKVVRLYKNHPVLSGQIEKVIEDARKTLTRPLPPYSVDEGGRLRESGCFWLPGWAFAYRVTGEKVFLDRSIALARHLADPEIYPNWLPAHYLNCAAVVVCVAMSYDWLYDDLTPEVRAVYEEAIYRNGIETGLSAYDLTTEGMNQHGIFGRSAWTLTENNWNAVCNSALTGACLALADVPAFAEGCEKLLTRIMSESIERGIRCYAPDGSYAESPSYWGYGTGNLFQMCEMLFSATGSTYGIMEAPGMKETCYYALHIESPDCGAWNYHDAGDASPMDHSHFLWVGNYLGDKALVKMRMEEILSGKRPATLAEFFWMPEEIPEADSTLPTTYNSVGIQTAVFRSGFASGSTFTGLHGGYNSVNHGDIDAGSFVYDDRGYRFFIDLGSDCYNMPGYFGKGVEGYSFRYYRKGAEGHNTIVIADDPAYEMRFGQDPTVTIPVTRFEPRDDGGVAVLDMTAAYGKTCIDGKRGMLISDHFKNVLIRDEISFSEPRSFWWFAHTRCDIELSADGRSAVLTEKRSDGAEGEARKLTVTIVGAPELFFTVSDAVGLLPSCVPFEKEYSREGIRKLVISVKNVTKAAFAVLLSETAPDTLPEEKEIKDW